MPDPEKLTSSLPGLEAATLGGGCFWCVEAALKQLEGVDEAVSGYTGGQLDHPSYDDICQGDSGHVEVVRFLFNPQKLDYRTLLTAFFTAHDPTTRDRQGNDVGEQYRSVIFTHSSDQARIAAELIADLDHQRIWSGPIVTEVHTAPRFWPAEKYHQDYFANNPRQPYCAAIVAPKVAKLRQSFSDRIKKG